MLYTLETMGLSPTRKRKVVYGKIHFSFMILGSCHFNYSFSFNPGELDIHSIISKIKIYCVLHKEMPPCISDTRVFHVICKCGNSYLQMYMLSLIEQGYMLWITQISVLFLHSWRCPLADITLILNPRHGLTSKGQVQIIPFFILCFSLICLL